MSIMKLARMTMYMMIRKNEENSTMTLYDELRLLADVNFREIYKQFLYIDCKELLDEMMPGEIAEDITGIFAYSYIDGTEGISFRPFMLAKMDEVTMQVFTFPHQEDTMYILRLRDGEVKMSEVHQNNRHMYLYALAPNKYHFINLDVINAPLDDYQEFKEYIDRTYDVDEDRELLRSEQFSFLDAFRNISYPDDVTVLLFDKEKGIEQVWVRTVMAADKEIFGELLNEPYQDFGCHEGELIGFVVARNGDEKVLVHTGHVARRADS